MHTIKQAIFILLFSFLATTTFAHDRSSITHPGFYLSVESGYTRIDYKNNFAPGYHANTVDRSGFANRIAAGFDITKNFGALFSVIYFHKPELRQINGPTNSKVKNNLVFLALKGMLPISKHFALSANGGIGYIVRSAVIVNNVVVLSNREIIRPVYGLGAAYLFWSRWAATLTWIQAPQKSSDNLPTSNYVGFGIRYKFAG